MNDRDYRPLTGERHAHDGWPYYCTQCGLGYAEYLACEGMDCTLEPQPTRIRNGTRTGEHKKARKAENFPMIPMQRDPGQE